MGWCSLTELSLKQCWQTTLGMCSTAGIVGLNNIWRFIPGTTSLVSAGWRSMRTTGRWPGSLSPWTRPSWGRARMTTRSPAPRWVLSRKVLKRFFICLWSLWSWNAVFLCFLYLTLYYSFLTLQRNMFYHFMTTCLLLSQPKLIHKSSFSSVFI